MATEAPAPAPAPELSPAVVLQWRSAGEPLIELLTRAAAVGPVCVLRLGGTTAALLTDPQGVQHVLARHPDRYVKRSHRLRALLGDGVVCAEGEPWKRQRRFLQRHFTGQGIRRFHRAIEDAARGAAGRWEAYARTGEAFDLVEEMRWYSLDVIWRALTGRGIDPSTQRELQTLQSIFAALPVLPGQGEQPSLAPHVARIDAVVAHTIEQARQAATHSMPTQDPGLLHTLLDAAAEHPEYTERLIRDEIVTLIVAGHETTATTLTWLYLLLDRNPRERALALAAGPRGSAARTAALQALLSECLRLYPAAWLLPRHAIEDDTVAGHRIEAGTTVLSSPYFTHRDPGLWPEPEAFRPRRFLTGEDRPTRPGAYYPFGLGPRACLGAQFALREATALLEHLLPAFVPTLHGAPPGAAFAVTINPVGPVTTTLAPDPAA
ncbi:cytochrome P450 [Streptomyces purpureus]|uniref:cytochrome P450 n=1 Tax=Streptomyces purpureus TaxID=1951 RepID=UPI0037AEDD02